VTFNIEDLCKQAEKLAVEQKLVQFTSLCTTLYHGQFLLAFEQEYHALAVLHKNKLLTSLGVTGWNDCAGWEAACIMHQITMQELQRRVKEVSCFSLHWSVFVLGLVVELTNLLQYWAG
jgi:hypothetical protein